MVVQAVMRAWLISRQQAPLAKQALPDFSHVQDLTRYPAGSRQPSEQHVLDEDASITVQKRLDVVPRRPGVAARDAADDGFWTSHLFWKGIVLGVIAVVLAKTAFHVQAPFGIDWYGF